MTKKVILILNNDYISKEIIIKLNKKYFVIQKKISTKKELENYLLKFKRKKINIFIIFSSLGLYYDKKFFSLVQPNLKYFFTPTTGLDHIDLNQIKKFKIKLVYLSQFPKFINSITSTAEHTWAIIMSLNRKIVNATNDVIINKNWNREKFSCREIVNKNLCIIGFGRLGKQIALYGKSFGMSVYAFDKKNKFFNKGKFKFVKYLNLKNLFKKADILTVHVPFNKKNNMFIKNYHLNLLKKNSTLVNTSRGNLFSEQKALELLKKERIYGLGLDVIDNDSRWNFKNKISRSFKSFKNSNLIITPHIGGNSLEARYKTSDFLLKKLL